MRRLSGRSRSDGRLRLFPQREYLHWETPFGTSDAVEDRRYEVASADGSNRYELMDASYLVEPEPRLWLLMIDANVFEPLNGTFEWGEEAAFTDSTSGGWNAMIRCKPFIVSWIADVCSRAEKLGKTLLAFSHYPVLDPFDGATGAEGALFGQTNIGLHDRSRNSLHSEWQPGRVQPH